MEEEALLHVHFAYIRRHVLLLDEPQMPMITIEANATYHFLFKHIPQHDINHIISYYAYFGSVQLDNLLQFLQQFFEHDANGRPTRPTFCWDTTIEVHEDVRDFNDDEDLMSSEIPFYQDICS